jgi:hypothetical protein
MRQASTFYWLSIKEAAGGTLSRANAAATIFGGLILWIVVLSFGGLKMEAPTSIAGAIGFAALLGAASFGVSWVVLFLWRLYGAPGRLYGSAQASISALNLEITALRNALKSDIMIILDQERYCVPQYFSDGTPSRLQFFIVVKNVGNTLLEHCQVRMMHDTGTDRQSPEYTRFASCAPFIMRPDDVRIVSVFYATEGDPENHLYIYNLIEFEGSTWKESEATPILLPGKVYNVTIEALSANTRKAILNLQVTDHNEQWIMKTA